MKVKPIVMFTTFVLSLCVGIFAGDSDGGQGVAVNESRIRLSFEGREAVVRLYDHTTTRDLLSRLPMTLTFQDYIGKEKISYLTNTLATDGTSPVRSGDFAYYAPWGNLAIFYRGNGSASGSLIVIGVIESGKDNLAAMSNDFTMSIERISQ